MRSPLVFRAASCALRDELNTFERRHIIVSVIHRAVGELRLLLRHLFVGDEVKQVTDAIEACPPFVVRANNVPGCVFRVACLEHDVARPRVLVPPASRAQICGAQLPLSQRIIDAGLEAALLLLVADLQPIFDEYDAVVDDEQFELGAHLEEAAMLRLRTETHYVLDAGTVVPTAVEDHDLASRREMREVTLEIYLRLLAIGRRRQRHHSENAWANPLGDRLDRAALPGGIASFEDHHNAQALLLDPVLQGAKLDLQLPQ